MFAPNGDTIHAFFYSDDDNWPSFADGHGESMEVIDLWGNYGDPLNWLPSRNVNGSPGLADVRGSSTSPLRITEMMYHPMPGTGSEFLEFYNRGPTPLDLSGIRVIEGVEFEFSLGFSTTLAANQRTSVVGSIAEFRSTYGAGPMVTGVFAANLANDGERLIVVDSHGDIIHDFVYDSAAPWPTQAGGGGRSLQIVDPSGDYRDASNWRASEMVGGSPSAGEPISGDFNDDGDWDCADIDLLSSAIATMSHDLALDMTGDGFVTAMDLDAWLVQGGQMNPSVTGGNPFLVGDADLSGTVDGVDFLIWNDHKFTNDSQWCRGNFDGNLSIDGTDFILWNDNKFQSSRSAIQVPNGGSVVQPAAPLEIRRQPVQYLSKFWHTVGRGHWQVERYDSDAATRHPLCETFILHGTNEL